MNAPERDIPGMLDRRPIVWSYSLLHCFDDVCPHQGEARYITKTIKFVETDAIRFGNAVHTAFEHRVGGGKPLPLEMQAWEKYARPFDGRGAKTEAWFQIDTEGKACDRNSPKKFGHGKIDLHIVNGDKAYINDWKTNKTDKYEDPFELEIGALLLKAKYPQLQKIVGQYTWLTLDKQSQVYDLSDVGKTWNRVCSIMQTIYNYRRIEEFPKKTGPLCAWCQRFDCENNTNQDRP